MPPTAIKLGPGQLELGAGPLEVNMQVLSCKVTPSENVTTTEGRKVLSGDSTEDTEDVEFTYVLEGSFLQDLAAGAVVDWSWTNKGTEQAFRFVPNDAAGRQVQGVCKPIPLSIGGDEVDGDMTSDFTWRIVGQPDFEAAP